MCCTRTNRSGWSFAETVIVIAITGIVATMGFAYMIAARPHAQLERAELALTGTLVEARKLALSEELNAMVKFDADAAEFWIEYQDRASGDWVAQGVHQVLPDGVAYATGGISFADNEVHFTPRGTLVYGGTLTIASGSETSTLTGNVATGRFPITGGNLR